MRRFSQTIKLGQLIRQTLFGRRSAENEERCGGGGYRGKDGGLCEELNEKRLVVVNDREGGVGKDTSLASCMGSTKCSEVEVAEENWKRREGGTSLYDETFGREEWFAECVVSVFLRLVLVTCWKSQSVRSDDFGEFIFRGEYEKGSRLLNPCVDTAFTRKPVDRVEDSTGQRQKLFEWGLVDCLIGDDGDDCGPKPLSDTALNGVGQFATDKEQITTNFTNLDFGSRIVQPLALGTSCVNMDVNKAATSTTNSNVPHLYPSVICVPQKTSVKDESKNVSNNGDESCNGKDNSSVHDDRREFLGSAGCKSLSAVFWPLSWPVSVVPRGETPNDSVESTAGRYDLCSDMDDNDGASVGGGDMCESDSMLCGKGGYRANSLVPFSEGVGSVTSSRRKRRSSRRHSSSGVKGSTSGAQLERRQRLWGGALSPAGANIGKVENDGCGEDTNRYNLRNTKSRVCDDLHNEGGEQMSMAAADTRLPMTADYKNDRKAVAGTGVKHIIRQYRRRIYSAPVFCCSPVNGAARGDANCGVEGGGIRANRRRRRRSEMKGLPSVRKGTELWGTCKCHRFHVELSFDVLPTHLLLQRNKLSNGSDAGLETGKATSAETAEFSDSDSICSDSSNCSSSSSSSGTDGVHNGGVHQSPAHRRIVRLINQSPRCGDVQSHTDDDGERSNNWILENQEERNTGGSCPEDDHCYPSSSVATTSDEISVPSSRDLKRPIGQIHRRSCRRQKTVSAEICYLCICRVAGICVWSLFACHNPKFLI